MTETTEWRWTRAQTGNYVHVEGDWVFSVGRNLNARPGRQWYVQTWPTTDPDNRQGKLQTRTGFTSMKLAKAGAVKTHCFHCGQWNVFSEVECERPDRRGEYVSWQCKDHEACAARVEARRAQMHEAEVAEALARQPYNVLEVRETEYGPQLRFGHEHVNPVTQQVAGHTTVVDVTEGDLVVLEAVLQQRRERRAREAASMVRPHVLELVDREGNPR